MSNNDTMNINIDQRETDCLYVDKLNLHTANNNEIIKFIVTDNKINKVDLYLNFISAIYELSYIEKILIKYLFYNKGVKHITNSIAVKDIKTNHLVSKSTILRGLASLNNKYLIAYSAEGEIRVSSKINNNYTKINNSKFYVIELDIKDNKVSI